VEVLDHEVDNFYIEDSKWKVQTSEFFASEIMWIDFCTWGAVAWDR
jgi:hypothetical protein